MADIKKESFEEKAVRVSAEVMELARKNGLEIKASVDFPIYKELPDEVRLCLIILSKHGMKVDVKLYPKETDIETTSENK